MRPRPLVLRLALYAAVACLAAPLSAAVAAPSAPAGPLHDCATQGKLLHTYTTGQLRHALDTMSPELKEYSDCYDIINRALLAQVGGHGGSGSGGSGGSFLPTWVIAVVIILLLLGAGFGALAVRRRREYPGEPPDGDGGAPPGP